jgi:hypothetical protein
MQPSVDGPSRTARSGYTGSSSEQIEASAKPERRAGWLNPLGLNERSAQATQWTALLEPACGCCYASKRFMLWTPTNKFLRNVAGLMPHPERACELLLGSDDGQWIFESIFAALKNKTVAQAA